MAPGSRNSQGVVTKSPTEATSPENGCAPRWAYTGPLRQSFPRGGLRRSDLGGSRGACVEGAGVSPPGAAPGFADLGGSSKYQGEP
ncbi:hypothetical protein JTE90_000029 [Oedothorax gibbosus]|uniref:Uncharacterized protein n=1 Tax=Oedothorax gibbosus TaxID=931172 RepID=A0AAV6TD07_9ARAC|nr:hypothetical protein JTE90_000029 [Oedothorax gibbosus]